MMIELYGGGFGNKGAELMLRTVLQKLTEASPSVTFCMTPAPGEQSIATSTYGFRRLSPTPSARGGRLFPARFLANRAISRLIPRVASEFAGVVRYRDVDALIDISGIRYGDAVGGVAAENLNLLAGYYRARGKPVILLPQMLGPFRASRSKSLFRGIARTADLIYARDRTSLAFAQEAAPQSTNLRLAPDITVFCDTEPAARQRAPYGCIVPNVRILDRGRVEWAPVYVDRLVTAAESMVTAGVHPVVLVHSTQGGEDAPLAGEVASRIGRSRCTVEVGHDPMELKALIAGARLVVASRYHSVVSALSSGVPAVVMGWAHKYDSLLEDFGVPQLAHMPSQGAEHVAQLVAMLSHGEEGDRVRDTLRRSRDTMRASHDTMWSEVLDRLGLREKLA